MPVLRNYVFLRIELKEHKSESLQKFIISPAAPGFCSINFLDFWNQSHIFLVFSSLFNSVQFPRTTLVLPQWVMVTGPIRSTDMQDEILAPFGSMGSHQFIQVEQLFIVLVGMSLIRNPLKISALELAWFE